ncbi:MAG: peroxiredoxin [Thermoplasmata archaeon]|nr:peroxiredoxin [Thermoplasmata archaeon]MCI4337757.1 peroxiredoxin [Thermoplasmata archaeon]MCI4341387.1 peroxiredoxin [Thermoplasmata archaeon]
MIAVGDRAPEFTGVTAEGAPFALSSTHGRPLVLYFYPKANTAGCTAEARGFTEHYPELRAKGVAVVGVSVDNVESQRNFAQKCGIPYPLIADRDRSIARSYGVLGLWGLARRVTFFLDAEGRVTRVVEGILPGAHVRAALER